MIESALPTPLTLPCNHHAPSWKPRCLSHPRISPCLAGGVDTPLMAAQPLRLPPPRRDRSYFAPLLCSMVVIVALSVQDSPSPSTTLFFLPHLHLLHTLSHHSPSDFRRPPQILLFVKSEAAPPQQPLPAHTQSLAPSPPPPPPPAQSSPLPLHHASDTPHSKEEHRPPSYPTLKHYGESGGTLHRFRPPPTPNPTPSTTGATSTRAASISPSASPTADRHLVDSKVQR